MEVVDSENESIFSDASASHDVAIFDDASRTDFDSDASMPDDVFVDDKPKHVYSVF